MTLFLQWTYIMLYLKSKYVEIKGDSGNSFYKIEQEYNLLNSVILKNASLA